MYCIQCHFYFFQHNFPVLIAILRAHKGGCYWLYSGFRSTSGTGYQSRSFPSAHLCYANSHVSDERNCNLWAQVLEWGVALDINMHTTNNICRYELVYIYFSSGYPKLCLKSITCRFIHPCSFAIRTWRSSKVTQRKATTV